MWRNYDAWGNPLEPENPIPLNEKKLPPAPAKRSYGWEEIQFPSYEKYREDQVHKAKEVERALKQLGIPVDEFLNASKGKQRKMRRTAVRNKSGRGKKNAQAVAANGILIENGYPLLDVEFDTHMETEFYELSSDED